VKYKIMLALAIPATVILMAAIINRKADTFTRFDGGLLESMEGRKAVLVELFTSEGCSSCPPADELLSQLDQSQSVAGAEVIALSEHVDYWNRLGWTDPFSSSFFSERQTEYSRVFGNDRIYTPQMVVDGQAELVGSNASRARNAISQAARAPKASVTLSASQSNDVRIRINIENLPALTDGDRAEVMLAITESGLQSNVSRGENSGRRLSHTAVTRRMEKLGAIEGDRFSAEAKAQIEKGWNRDRLRAVVFVQENKSRRVLGAAAIRLNEKP